MSLIAVFNQKGGVGKTTTTLNIAACLAMLDRHPAVIDLDPQGHVSLALGVRNTPGIFCASAFFREGSALQNLVKHLPGGVRLIPSHPDLTKVDATLAGTPGVAGLLRKGILAAPDLRDATVLVDCAPSLGVLSMNALWAAQRVLIPVTPDYLAMQGLNRLDIALRVLEQPLGRAIERRVVMTRFHPDQAHSQEAMAALKARYGPAVCETTICDDPALAESPAQGKDIFAHAGDCPGAHDYRRLTMELLAKGFFA